MTSATNACPPSWETQLVTVRQTPLTAMDAPSLMSARTVVAPMTSRAEARSGSTAATTPSSSTIPVNITGVPPCVGTTSETGVSTRDVTGAWAPDGPYATVRTAGRHTPARVLPSGLSPSVPEFHRVHRPLAADGSRTVTAGSEFHRPRSARATATTCPSLAHESRMGAGTPGLRIG